MRRFFDYDPVTGAVEMFEYDNDTGAVHITRTAPDIEPHFDANAERHNHHHNMHPVLGAHVASVPLELVHKIMIERGLNMMDMRNWSEIKKLLNDSDFRRLRVKGGRL